MGVRCDSAPRAFFFVLCNYLIYCYLQRKCKKNAPKFWYVRKKQYLCNVKRKATEI